MNDLDSNTYHIYLITVVTYEFFFTFSIICSAKYGLNTNDPIKCYIKYYFVWGVYKSSRVPYKHDPGPSRVTYLKDVRSPLLESHHFQF